MRRQIGSRVQILGGMTEFVGKTGRIMDVEKTGKGVFYRVGLDEPVEVAGVGRVTDDLWQGHLLRTIRERRARPGDSVITIGGSAGPARSQDDVAPEDRCANCGERRQDMLVWFENADQVSCESCGYVYRPSRKW